MNLPKIILHQAKTAAIARFHPWVFSGAIKYKSPEVTEDALIELCDSKGQFLAIGYYTDSNIAVRIISFSPIKSVSKLFEQKLSAAYDARQAVALINNATTSAYRLIHGEGDGLSGLIIDIYNGVAVLQAHSVFMSKQLPIISELLQQLYGKKLQAVYNKSSNTLPKSYTENQDGFLFGKLDSVKVLENNCTFEIDFIEGQKTGFFLDQRENRALLGRYAEGKNVLNTFCYSGGFSVYAAKAGAEKVVSVDVSQKAIDLTIQNMQLNGFDAPHEAHKADIFEFLSKTNISEFDIIVLDPPAFAKNVGARHQAIKAYTRLNLEVLAKMKKGALLFTFSCSQVVTPDLFKGAIVAAAITAGRNVRIVHQLSQGADHPVSAFHPEGSYLKGFVLQIE